MQMTDVCNQSERNAFERYHIRQRESAKAVSSFSCATMSGCNDLSYFELGVILGTQEKGQSMSDVAMEFAFSLTTISPVYREHQVTGKISNLRQWYDRNKILI